MTISLLFFFIILFNVSYNMETSKPSLTDTDTIKAVLLHHTVSSEHEATVRHSIIRWRCLHI